MASFCYTTKCSAKNGNSADYDWSSTSSIKDTIKDKRSFIENKASAEGRYEVYCSWKKGDAHVFIVERTHKGDLIWYDPQSGKRGANIVSYVKEMRSDMIGVLRIDDKMINPKFAERSFKRT